MPLTVRDLVSTPELALRLLPPADGEHGAAQERAITWVHVSELRDPTPFLSGGELLLTTGLPFAAEDEEADVRGYVERLAAADVVGLGFGIGLSHAQVPAALVAAAANAGLPIVEVPRQTPFIAISRAVSKAVAADEYASVTRTFTAQQELTKAALAEAGPDRVVRLLARQMEGWVVLLDPVGAVLAEHPVGPARRARSLAVEIVRLATHRGTVSSGFPLGDDVVSLQSVGAGPRGRAFLAVGRPAPLTATDRHLVNAAVMLLTLRLEQSPAADVGVGRLRSALLQLLLAGQAGPARSIAEQLAVPLPDEPMCVVVASGTPGAVRMLLGEAPGWPGSPFTAELDADLVVMVGGDPALAAELAARMVEVAGDGVAVGMSAAATDTDIATAYRQARQAAGFAARSPRRVASFDEIAMPGIAGMLSPELANAFAQSLLGPLIEHDRAGRGDLVKSLRAWLGHHGQWEPAAAELGVHRHTLRNRITTAGQLIGRDLDSPGVRGELWLALEMTAP